MSEATTGAPPATDPQSVAIIKPGRIIAHSDTPIWDTASFEHMGRVGALMADSGMCSETLLTDEWFDADGTKKTGPAERAVVVARMVMIADMAREVGANPMMFLQGVSRIGRKLHIEGKNVNAIIRVRTGVELAFRFGLWDTDHIEFAPLIDATDANGEALINPETGEVLKMPDPKFLHGAGDRLAIHVYDPERPERFVEGSAGMWKTTRNGSPWSNVGNYPRQLRYRGAPEWARAYEPGAILGIWSDADQDEDDFDHATAAQVPGRRQKRNLAAKLTGQGHDGEHGAQGFDRNGIAAEMGDDTKPKPVDVQDTIPAGEGGDALDVEVEDIEGDDGETRQDAGEATVTNAGTDTAQSLADKLQPLAEQFARMSPQDEPIDLIMTRLCAAHEAGETITPGHADVGEKYIVAGEVVNGEGRRLVYLDGVRFSAVKDVAKFKAYAIHAPLKVEGDEGGDRPTATDGVPAAEPEPATSGTATTASGDGAPPAAASGQSAQPEPDDQDQAQEGGFLATLRPMTKFRSDDLSEVTIKKLYTAMTKTSDWIGASEFEQDEVKRAVWAEVERVRADHDDKIDHAEDVTAFGLWMSTQPLNRDGADAVEGTFRTLQNEEVFKKLPDASKDTLKARVDAFLKRARGQ